MMKRKHLECKVGAKQRARRRKIKTFLPFIIVGNVRSLENRLDKLGVLMRMQWECLEYI